MIPVGHKVKKWKGKRKIQRKAINFQHDSLVCMNLALINRNLLRLHHNSGMQLCREDKAVTRTITAPRTPQQSHLCPKMQLWNGASDRIVRSWKTVQCFIDI